MVEFDSDEYWFRVTWDRFQELYRVPPRVSYEFLHQEQLTISAVSAYVNSQVANSATLRILDLGCGTGRLSKLLLERFRGNIQLTYLDFNIQTLKIAQRNLADFSNSEPIEESVYQLLRFEATPFDVILCIDIFHHISNLEKLVQSISSALKLHGILIGNAFIEDKYKEWEVMKYGTLKSWRRRYIYWLASEIYPYAPNCIRVFIRRYGFARIKPLNAQLLESILKKYFRLIQCEKNYYMWFSAQM